MPLSDSILQSALSAIQEAFQKGIVPAKKALHLLTKRNLEIKVDAVKKIPFEEVSHYRFPEDVPVVIIVLRLHEMEQGFLAFVMFEESAKKINQILWEETPESCEVLNLSNISAIKEMGNIIGSCLLNQLANDTGIELRPSEPIFIFDLMAAVMQVLILEQSMTSDHAILIDTKITCAEEGISFDVLFLPSGELLTQIAEGAASHG